MLALPRGAPPPFPPWPPIPRRAHSAEPRPPGTAGAGTALAGCSAARERNRPLPGARRAPRASREAPARAPLATGGRRHSMDRAPRAAPLLPPAVAAATATDVGARTWTAHASPQGAGRRSPSAPQVRPRGPVGLGRCRGTAGTVRAGVGTGRCPRGQHAVHSPAEPLARRGSRTETGTSEGRAAWVPPPYRPAESPPAAVRGPARPDRTLTAAHPPGGARPGFPQPPQPGRGGGRAPRNWKKAGGEHR